MGASCYLGQGVRQDYIEALHWYEKAANQGHAVAQFNLGEMYQYGQGVRIDLTTAKELYGKACDGGLLEDFDKGTKLNLL